MDLYNALDSPSTDAVVRPSRAGADTAELLAPPAIH
jgi:hypothetical protein